MGKGKLKKWEENATFEHVFEPPLDGIIGGRDFMKGTWHSEVFGNNNPITLELGCGKGEYTVELARRYPNRNFVGVDIKGHRFWRGAKISKNEGLTNVAFLRTRIEFIAQFFEENEVNEIWLTFSDPQPKDEKGNKRLTSAPFLARYRQIMPAGAVVNLKTDSPILYTFTHEVIAEQKLEILVDSADVYGELIQRIDAEMKDVLMIQTAFEKRWLSEGCKIHFTKFKL
ncbi:MAG: tRNA (guanosine(46)-N7)-methyltransferase TrmB [Cryomorphaceae bacterium]|nr:tRNA (guanosine(46)-N7)-methyltransferase TrmB [Cryomorphaceae bacterium]